MTDTKPADCPNFPLCACFRTCRLRAKEAAEPTATLSAEERAAFEAWCDQESIDRSQDMDFSYFHTATETLWSAWQASAARLATARREGMLEAAKIADAHATPDGVLGQRIATAIRNAARTASTTGTVERPRDTGPGHAQTEPQ